MDTLNSSIQLLLDKQAITEVLYRYARACDRADQALLRSCFHPDSDHRHGHFAGTSSDFCTFAMTSILAVALVRHQITNVLIEVDGDVARSECQYEAFHRKINTDTGAAEDYFTGGRYLDRFERRDDLWLIAARAGLVDFERYDPVSERTIIELPEAARSRRCPDDPLYELMPSLAGRR